jgi:hypothetical protein
MRHIAANILIACVAQVHAEVAPLHQADLDNVTLSVLMSRVPAYQKGPQSFGTPQQSRHVAMSPQWFPHSFPTAQRSTLTAAAADQSAAEWIQTWKAKQAGGGGAAPFKAQDTPQLWETNVFGDDIKECPAMDGSGLTCKYKGDAPQICVGVGARQRVGSTDEGWLAASDARSFVLQKPMEAFLWNDGLLAECISIWDYTGETGTDIGAWFKYGNSDIIPKCDAMPAAVLKSEYTVETYATCEYEAREYKYVSPASSKWSGDNSVVTKKDPFFLKKDSIGEEGIPKSSTRCARFRKVVNELCDICSVQASGKGKEAIDSQCAALKATVPDGADDRAGKWLPFKVFRRGMPWKMGEKKALFTSDVFDAPSAAALMCIFMASGLIFAMVRFRRRTSTIAVQPFLG